MDTMDTKMGVGDWIIVSLVAACATFCLYLTHLTFVQSETVEQTVVEQPAYDESRWESQDAWHHFVECQAICDNYGVLLKVWSWPDKIIQINIPEDHLFTTGTDGACQAFGIMAETLLDIYADGWLLYATGDFVPSSEMPIDLEWARQLAEGY